MQDSDQIQLLDIQTTNFNAELFLKYLLYRGELAFTLSQYLESAISKKLIDDNNNQYNLQILRICVVQYNYYQLSQGTNFLSEYKYVGMANQLKKIFKDEKEYKNEIETFFKVETPTSKKLRQEIKNLYEQCSRQRNAIPNEFQKIANYFKQQNQGDLKFERFQQQLMSKENQVNYDIYSYFFKLYYQQEWFTSNQQLQTIKLQCYITYFLKFDNEYPIQCYADQMLIFQKILDDQPIEYYKTLIMDQI